MVQEVKRRKQWGKKIIGTTVGATAAAFAAPVVAGAISGGIIGIAVTGVTTGAIGSIVTRVTNNIIESDDILEVSYNPHQAKETFRTAIENFLEATFNPVCNSIRRNQRYDVDITLQPNLDENLQVLRVSATSTSRLCLKIVMHVRPRPGTKARDIEDGVEPLALPVFQRNTEQVFRLPRKSDTLLTGIPRSAVKGMLMGAIFAPAVVFVPFLQHFHWFRTVLNSNVGVLLGTLTVTGVSASALELTQSPAEFATLASYVDFGAELNTQFNRVKECGELNGVDVSYNVIVKLEHLVNTVAGIVDVQGSQVGNRNSFEYRIKVD